MLKTVVASVPVRKRLGRQPLTGWKQTGPRHFTKLTSTKEYTSFEAFFGCKYGLRYSFSALISGTSRNNKSTPGVKNLNTRNN